VGNSAAEQQKHNNAKNQEMPVAEAKHEMLFRGGLGYVLALPPKPAPNPQANVVKRDQKGGNALVNKFCY
jgi:hypothetical protein